jgi:ribosomal protein S25
MPIERKAQRRKLEQGYAKISKPIDDWAEEFDYRDSEEYIAQHQELKDQMRTWIENVSIVSYGAIGRRYEEYPADMIEAVIKELSAEGIVKYEAYKPAPQMIKLNTEPVRVPAQTLGFNNQSRETFEKMIESRKSAVKKTKDAKQVEMLFEVAA